MAWNGAILAASVAPYKIPTLGISEAFNQAPLVISGALIALFLDRTHRRAPARRGSGARVALTILCVTFAVFSAARGPGRLCDRLSAVCTILWRAAARGGVPGMTSG